MMLVIYTQRDRQENEPGWPKEEIAQSRASIMPIPRPNLDGVPGPFIFIFRLQTMTHSPSSTLLLEGPLIH